MRKEIPVYYSINKNFGDSLNVDLFKKIYNVDITMQNIQKAEVLGIGSLLECVLKSEELKNTEENQRPICIFSTGFGFASGQHSRKVIQPEQLIRNVKCYAVRGKMSLERMQRLTGDSLENVVIADGGLLAGKLLNEKENIRKKYTLGIVPHMADRENKLWDELVHNIEGAQIIDVTQETMKVLRELARCEAVISSAMHPLIACDSLGIPNAWVKVSNIPSEYKFKDYYSAFDMVKEPYTYDNILKDKSLIGIIKENYDIPREMVKEKQEQLLCVMDRMWEELEKNNCFYKKRFTIKNLMDSIYKEYLVDTGEENESLRKRVLKKLYKFYQGCNES